MMALIRRFERSVEEVERSVSKLSRVEELKLYGLMQQGYFGDNATPRPWFFQFDASAKWDAWTAEKGKSMISSKSEHIGLSFKILHDVAKSKTISSTSNVETNDEQATK